MLILKGITKDYTAGDTHVQALKGIDITFRENEFVSILGPSRKFDSFSSVFNY